MGKNIQFTTPVNISSQVRTILCDSEILTLGSCFSDHIGNKLDRHYFNATVNPFGTVFNPISIAKLLEMSVDDQMVVVDELHRFEDRHFHYDFHSSFDSTDPTVVSSQINDALSKVRTSLKKVNFLILTFGTSIVYKLKSQNRIVSNCHKVPAYNFEKSILDIGFMTERLTIAIQELRKINPGFELIVTVSPVRHTKDGLVDNNLSKSRLVGLCHNLLKAIPNTSYFPSFELMMDELRDYRYYKSDLIHPSELAIDIIWSRFVDAYFDENSKQKVEDIDSLLKASEHRPFDSNSEGHKKFKTHHLEKIQRLKKRYPEVNFDGLIQHFS